MKENKLEKRIGFVLCELHSLGIEVNVSVYERDGKAIKSYLDDSEQWNDNDTYYDSFEYHFWNFCVMNDDEIDLYENKCIHAIMQYDVDENFSGENKIDLLVFFKKDKTVEIVGMDYYLQSDFHYKIEEKFKKGFKLSMSDFMNEYHLENNILLAEQKK